jgi:hypothetical protein
MCHVPVLFTTVIRGCQVYVIGLTNVCIGMARAAIAILVRPRRVPELQMKTAPIAGSRLFTGADNGIELSCSRRFNKGCWRGIKIFVYGFVYVPFALGS